MPGSRGRGSRRGGARSQAGQDGLERAGGEHRAVVGPEHECPGGMPRSMAARSIRAMASLALQRVSRCQATISPHSAQKFGTVALPMTRQPFLSPLPEGRRLLVSTRQVELVRRERNALTRSPQAQYRSHRSAQTLGRTGPGGQGAHIRATAVGPRLERLSDRRAWSPRRRASSVQPAGVASPAHGGGPSVVPRPPARAKPILIGPNNSRLGKPMRPDVARNNRDGSAVTYGRMGLPMRARSPKTSTNTDVTAAAAWSAEPEWAASRAIRLAPRSRSADARMCLRPS